MELIKDCDMKLHYHPGKANVVDDALRRKSHVNTLMTGGLPKELAEDLLELCLEIVPRGYVAALEIRSTLMDKIREAQKTDKEIAEIKERMSKVTAKGFPSAKYACSDSIHSVHYSMCYIASIFHVPTHFRAATFHVADFSDDE